jgi:hypothetical protein
MNSKLTLRLDDNLIQSAKKYSVKTGKSVSKIVSNYFALIDATLSEKPLAISRLTSSLKGCLKNPSVPVSEEDYKEYIERKYL